MRKVILSALMSAILVAVFATPVLAWEEEYGDGWVSSNTGVPKHYFVPVTVEEYRVPGHDYSYYRRMDVSEAAWDRWEAAGYSVIYSWCDPAQRLLYRNTDGFAAAACVHGDADGPGDAGGKDIYTVKTARLSIEHVAFHSCPSLLVSAPAPVMERPSHLPDSVPVTVIFTRPQINLAYQAGAVSFTPEQLSYFEIDEAGNLIRYTSALRLAASITPEQRLAMYRFLIANEHIRTPNQEVEIEVIQETVATTEVQQRQISNLPYCD